MFFFHDKHMAHSMMYMIFGEIYMSTRDTVTVVHYLDCISCLNLNRIDGYLCWSAHKDQQALHKVLLPVMGKIWFIHDTPGYSFLIFSCGSGLLTRAGREIMRVRMCDWKLATNWQHCIQTVLLIMQLELNWIEFNLCMWERGRGRGTEKEREREKNRAKGSQNGYSCICITGDRQQTSQQSESLSTPQVKKTVPFPTPTDSIAHVHAHSLWS